MKTKILLLSVLFGFIGYVQAIALTFALEAQEKSCYYGEVYKPNTKISFYFVVQKGGSFDVDYSIEGPDGRVLYAEERTRGTEFVFNGEQLGEYKFCFSNDMSTMTTKVVSFELNFESSKLDIKAELPKQVSEAIKQEAVSVESSINGISFKLNTILRDVQYLKVRNNRDQSTVASTESRIVLLSIFGGIFMLGMSLLQVTIVHLFFKTSSSRKRAV